MRDMQGKTLQVGDRVAVAVLSGKSAHLRFGVIVDAKPEERGPRKLTRYLHEEDGKPKRDPNGRHLQETVVRENQLLRPASIKVQYDLEDRKQSVTRLERAEVEERTHGAGTPYEYHQKHVPAHFEVIKSE